MYFGGVPRREGTESSRKGCQWIQVDISKLQLRVFKKIVFSSVMKRVFGQKISKLCVLAQQSFSFLLNNCLFLCLQLEELAAFFLVSLTFYNLLTAAFLYNRFYLTNRSDIQYLLSQLFAPHHAQFTLFN